MEEWLLAAKMHVASSGSADHGDAICGVGCCLAFVEERMVLVCALLILLRGEMCFMQIAILRIVHRGCDVGHLHRVALVSCARNTRWQGIGLCKCGRGSEA